MVKRLIKKDGSEYKSYIGDYYFGYSYTYFVKQNTKISEIHLFPIQIRISKEGLLSINGMSIFSFEFVVYSIMIGFNFGIGKVGKADEQ